ncbi:MAG: ATP-binding protein [Lachnospiraceae bacterium]|nr:ATP-binding protein [Lachnospiraceae bacterium]
MEKLEYIIEDSTIAEVLGVQNFSNEESAVLELVKNAYDAQSPDVIINISKTKMVIEDTGVGMNREKILEAWMHVGKSDKDYMEWVKMQEF